ncbi:hypothetical protein KKA95_04540 [Patescibacteria group bacterium]|nr:hypothetical protein [Patescibacteria group bacterium]
MKPLETPTTTPQFLLAMAQTLEIEVGRYEDDGVLIVERVARVLTQIEEELSNTNYRESLPKLGEILENHQSNIDYWKLLTIKIQVGKEINSDDLNLGIEGAMELAGDLNQLAATTEEHVETEEERYLRERREELGERILKMWRSRE